MGTPMSDVAVRTNALSRLNFSVLKTGLLSALPGLLFVAIFQPHSPDLVAQLARAAMSEASQGATWLTSWYGGISTPGYSAITPELMRLMGVWTVGITSALATIYSAARILEAHIARARLAIMFVSFAVTANLVSGRITFSVGAAFATLSLMYLLRRQPFPALAFGISASLGSPLAGMFLVMILLCMAVDRHVRPLAMVVAVGAGVPVLTTQLLYPQEGTMPMQIWDIALGLAACIAMWLCKPSPILKRLAVLLALGVVFFTIVETPVGANIIRLPMLFMAAAVAVSATAHRRLVAGVLVLCIAWISITSAVDLFRGQGESFDKSYYAPLLEQLPVSGDATHRLEVIDPKTHGPALYVAPLLPIARGWERQTDVTRNPIFYDGKLSADTYRAWLDELAVKWVALPNVPLDYASAEEGELVRSGLPYLTKIWSNEDWHLYEVQSPAPLANGVFEVQQMGIDSITFSAFAPGEGEIKVAWARGLNLSGVGMTTEDGEITRNGDYIRYSVPAAGTYRLSNVAQPDDE
jgi:hypothetical protein